MRHFLAFIVCSTVLLAGGCGQMGPLYTPTAVPAPEATAPTDDSALPGAPAPNEAGNQGSSD